MEWGERQKGGRGRQIDSGVREEALVTYGNGVGQKCPLVKLNT